jgi:hypothetical protein
MATKSIPVSSRKVLRPSIINRIKSVLKRAGSAVKRVAKAVVAKTKTVTKTAWSKTATAWRKALRPLLKTFGMTLAAFLWVSTLVAAPVATLALTTGVGLLLIATARALEALEASDARIAEMTVTAIEVIVQAFRVAFYTWSAAVAIVTIPVWAPVAAILGMTALIVHTLPRSEQAHEAPMQDLEDLEVPAIKRRQKIEKVEVFEAEVVEAKPKTIRAIGAEEMRDMSACDACGSIEGALRAKSHRRNSDATHDAWLCSECYDLECEDDAIRYTGVSLKRMSVEVRLNKEGLATTREHAASLVDNNVHWTPTSWWRDKVGTLHEREWSGFVGGEVVANVMFDYRRGTYRMLVMGKPPRDVGAQRDRGSAQRLATDIWNDTVLRLEREITDGQSAHTAQAM